MTLLRLAARALRAGILILALAGVVGGCAHTLGDYAAGVRVDCNLPDATVWIDDLLAGSAAEWKREGHQIRAGFHRIEIRHPGYYSVFREIELPEGGQAIVKAPLRQVIE